MLNQEFSRRVKICAHLAKLKGLERHIYINTHLKAIIKAELFLHEKDPDSLDVLTLNLVEETLVSLLGNEADIYRDILELPEEGGKFRAIQKTILSQPIFTEEGEQTEYERAELERQEVNDLAALVRSDSGRIDYF